MASRRVSDHTAGGYFLVRSAEGSPPWMPPEFGVKRTISASSELVPIFPTPTWADAFDLVARKFGLAEEDRVRAGQLADDLFNEGRLGWPNVFYDVADALSFYDRFARGRTDVLVIGIGLVEDNAEPFSAATAGSGVATRFGRREPLAGGGSALGYEILGMDSPTLESWAVNLLPELVRDRLGICVNDDGLIWSFDEATLAAEFVSRPDVPSEPLDWKPWILVQYPPGSAGF